jgi:hypothetical protein
MKKAKGELMIVEEINYPRWVSISDDLEFYQAGIGEVVTDIGHMAQELPRVLSNPRRRTELIRQLRAAARALAYAERGELLYRAQAPGQLLVFYGVAPEN